MDAPGEPACERNESFYFWAEREREKKGGSRVGGVLHCGIWCFKGSLWGVKNKWPIVLLVLVEKEVKKGWDCAHLFFCCCVDELMRIDQNGSELKSTKCECELCDGWARFGLF